MFLYVLKVVVVVIVKSFESGGGEEFVGKEGFDEVCEVDGGVVDVGFGVCL